MERTSGERISQRAYQIWEAEGRPFGRHDEHWRQAERELGGEPGTGMAQSHPGMLGDGTEEQNLDQPGTPGARISEDEVVEAFGGKAGN